MAVKRETGRRTRTVRGRERGEGREEEGREGKGYKNEKAVGKELIFKESKYG